MIKHHELSGPVVVGGVGGSGTRVVAEVLLELGFFLGKDLNLAGDNLAFSLLFKRPTWFLKCSHSKQSEIFRGLHIFEKAMTGSSAFGLRELGFILRAATEMSFTGHDHVGRGKRLWPYKRARNLVRSEISNQTSNNGLWGWKEPNTHIYLEYLARHFDDLKYIHVMRHGLDMAFSRNQSQLYNWGSIFKVSPPTSPKFLPKQSLNYWSRSNKRALDLGQRLLGDRFLIINFDNLCLSPRQHLESLIDFLDLEFADVDLRQLYRLTKIPRSMRRYKKYDLTIFNRTELDTVEQFGFSV